MVKRKRWQVRPLKKKRNKRWKSHQNKNIMEVTTRSWLVDNVEARGKPLLFLWLSKISRGFGDLALQNHSGFWKTGKYSKTWMEIQCVSRRSGILSYPSPHRRSLVLLMVMSPGKFWTTQVIESFSKATTSPVPTGSMTLRQDTLIQSHLIRTANTFHWPHHTSLCGRSVLRRNTG